jgi:hypothetical protein
MSRLHKEGVLSRWSRRKRESARSADETEELPARTPVELEADAGKTENDAPEREGQQPIELPSIDELGPDSDFQGFMKPDVDDGLRRAALKKLFRDPHFNVTDGLDVYAEDYTKLESLTPSMVAGLKHARSLLFNDTDANSDTHGDKQSGVARTKVETERRLVDEGAHQTARITGKGDPQRERSEQYRSEVEDCSNDDGDLKIGADPVPRPEADTDADKSDT